MIAAQRRGAPKSYRPFALRVGFERKCYRFSFIGFVARKIDADWSPTSGVAVGVFENDLGLFSIDFRGDLEIDRNVRPHDSQLEI